MTQAVLLPTEASCCFPRLHVHARGVGGGLRPLLAAAQSQLCFCGEAPLVDVSLCPLQISDALQENYTTSTLWRFLSLGYALMLCPFIIVLGGMFFLVTALFFLDDREKAEKQ